MKVVKQILKSTWNWYWISCYSILTINNHTKKLPFLNNNKMTFRSKSDYILVKILILSGQYSKVNIFTKILVTFEPLVRFWHTLHHLKCPWYGELKKELMQLHNKKGNFKKVVFHYKVDNSHVLYFLKPKILPKPFDLKSIHFY